MRKARNKIGIKNTKIHETTISQRSEYIKQRQEFGYWEGDTVQGKKKKGKVIISLVEKMTRYSIFVKVKGKDNESIKQELRKILKEYKKKGEVFNSITLDNWSEFSEKDK